MNDRHTSFLIVILFLFIAPPAAAQHIPELLQQHVSPFETIEELAPLTDQIGNERLVLMGEASHGTSEFYTKRAFLSQKLIEDRNFSFIAVEADWSSFSRINEFVKHKPGASESLDEAMASIDRWPLWMWRNHEVRELVSWLHEYNRTLAPEDRIGIYGIDVYDNYKVMNDVLEWISGTDAEMGNRAAQAYSCLTRYQEPGDYIRMVAQSGEDCSEDLNEVLEIVQALEAETGGWEYFRAEHGAKAAINAELHYRANLEQSAASWNYRASHFYLTAERLLDYYGEESRGIIWAHNTHIGDARATEMGRQGAVNIGQLSREALGRENTFAIGFGTYTGNVLAAFNWEGEMQDMEIPEAASDSWEGMLEATGHEKLYLTFSEEALRDALGQWIPHRAIGVSYNPQNDRGNYVQTVLPERYDAFIFIRNTGILSPLD